MPYPFPTASMKRTHKSRMQRICIVGAAVVLLGVHSAAAMVHLDGIAAVVGDEIILLSELEAYTLMRLNTLEQSSTAIDPDTLRREFLEELIDGKVMLVHAVRDSAIRVSADDVEEALNEHLARLRQQSGLSESDFEQELEAQGLNPVRFRSQMRRMFREQLLKQQMQQAHIGRYRPTRREVEEFYHTYRDSLPMLGESCRLLKLELVLVPSDSTRRAAWSRITSLKTRLDNGEDFAALARQFSQDPSAQQGGNIGFVAKGTLNELTFEEQAFALRPGDISEPFETRLGWHIIKVHARRDQMVDVSQIFIPVRPSPRQQELLTARLDSLAASISTPEQFREAVQRFSQDPPSRARGGDIGWFHVNHLPSRYREAFTVIESGAISKPVVDEQSVALLMIASHVHERTLTLEDDWELLEEKTRDIAAQKRLLEQVDKWRKDVLIDIRI